MSIIRLSEPQTSLTILYQMIYITSNFMSHMGKRETRFLKVMADGLGIQIDDDQ